MRFLCCRRRRVVTSSPQFIQKREKLQSHSLVSLLRITALRKIVIEFGGVTCYYPLLYLIMETLTKDDKENLKFVFTLNNWRDIPSRKNLLLNMNKLHLYRWYVETYSMSSLRGYIPFSCGNPYSEGHTIEDLDFYFQWITFTVGSTYSWRNPLSYIYSCLSSIDVDRPKSKDNRRDAAILANHYGYIPLWFVPRSYMNIVACILGGRYDIAAKYVERGDMEGHIGEVRSHLSTSQTEMLSSYISKWNLKGS